MLTGNEVQNAAIQAAELEVTAATIALTNNWKPFFDPEEHDLDSNFRLASFWSMNRRPKRMIDPEKAGLGSNCTITSLPKNAGLQLVQCSKQTYPIIDDPYLMGRIACANLLSPLYAFGLTTCDTLIANLFIAQELNDKEQKTIIPIIVKGMKDCATEANCCLVGGETTTNPWLSIGGCATTICKESDHIFNDAAEIGDVLVLTKPLGTVVAAHAFQWLEDPDRWNRVKLVVNDEEVRRAYIRSIDMMCRLNLIAARLMRKFEAHAVTEIGSNGLLGDAQHLASKQKNEVAFVIHNLPVIAKMAHVAKAYGQMFPLTSGLCPEVSGGLLMCFPREQAAAFCKEIEKQEGYPAWIIGVVEKGDRIARLIDKPRVIEVPVKEQDDSLW